MNIRGQINWWQLAIVLVSGCLTGIIAAANHVVGMQGQLAESIGGVLAMALVSAITAGVAMISGRPVKEIAEDVVESVAGKGQHDATPSGD